MRDPDDPNILVYRPTKLTEEQARESHERWKDVEAQKKTMIPLNSRSDECQHLHMFLNFVADKDLVYPIYGDSNQDGSQTNYYRKDVMELFYEWKKDHPDHWTREECYQHANNLITSEYVRKKYNL
jgi:hypothetical protein